ncbi:Ig-like domain-containing protein [Microbulbifer sp. A4B17]|uniref:Ig-like domain-containing protein n=1 Tax=Microbulbifer sp. A4B17 TaxID=359370 RepID=UPI00130045BE|nr:Ig-like domain-containing protein [Microbulbifer sp. A4B17]
MEGKFFKANSKFIKAALALAISSVFYGCSGGSGGGGEDPAPVDTTPPSLTLTPASGASIAATDTLLLDFSEAVALADVSLSGAIQEMGELSQVDQDTLILTPIVEWTEGLELSLTIAAQDAAGNQMAEVVAHYTVEGVAPSVVSVSPAQERLEKGGAITVQFSKSMDRDSLQISGSLLDDEYTLTWSQSRFNDDTLVIAPKSRWLSGQDRSLQLEAKDLAGLDIPAEQHNFTVPLYFENFDSAQVVIGQDNFSSTLTAINAKNLGEGPQGSAAVTDEGKLFLPDYTNNRVLIFNSIPTSNGVPANAALNKDSLDDGTGREFGSQPTNISFDSGKLLINYFSGPWDHSIYVYDTIPEDGRALPSAKLLKDSCQGNVFVYSSAMIAKGRVFAASSSMARVAVWDDLPSMENAAPDWLLGQSTLENCTANDREQDGSIQQPSARTLAMPGDVWSDGEKLAITDSENNRVLLWNSMPTSSFAPADIVLGQADFVSNESQPPSRKTLSLFGRGIWSNGIQLFVADSDNNRVLIWNQWPQENFAPADVVLGQGDFDRSAFNDSNQNGVTDEGELPSAATLKWPDGITAYEDKLIINDSGNNRFLIFQSR